MSVTAGVEHKLAQLKLGRIRQVYAAWVAEAERQQRGDAEFLDELLSEELRGRQEKPIRHHGEVFYLRGPSYRMRGKEVIAAPAAPSAPAAAPAP